MKIRAILMDMDGTLLGKGQVAVSTRNMRAVQAALKKGIHVIPCTGRVYDMLPPQLLSQEGLRYFVTSHGANAYDLEKNESIYTDLIPPEEASQLMKILEGKGLYNEIAARGTVYLEEAVAKNLDMSLVPEHHVWYVRDHCYTEVSRPSEFFAKEGIGLEKMNIYNIPAHLQESIYEEVTATGFIAHTRPGAGPHLEFSHHTLSKPRATDAILERLGVSYEETLAIGDSSSDYEIIKACGFGVAMGNAPDYIKEAADFVTDLNVNDGFAKAIEEFVL